MPTEAWLAAVVLVPLLLTAALLVRPLGAAPALLAALQAVLLQGAWRVS